MLALLAALQSLAAVVPSTPWASVQPTQDSPEDQFIRVAPLGSIGGCAAYAPRASYSWLDDQGQGALVCDASTPGRTCGGHSEAASFPSGMQLPRHNVPQFLQQQGELVPLLKDEMLRVLRIAEETEAAEMSAG